MGKQLENLPVYGGDSMSLYVVLAFLSYLGSGAIKACNQIHQVCYVPNSVASSSSPLSHKIHAHAHNDVLTDTCTHQKNHDLAPEPVQAPGRGSFSPVATSKLCS